MALLEELRSLVLCALFLTVLMCAPHGARALTCLCDETTCEEPRGCVGGTVLDVCHCCRVCAKQRNETCGGMYDLHGTCDRGLRCVPPAPAKRFFGFEPGYCEEVHPDCDTARCELQLRPFCPEDSMQRVGHIPPGECCPLPSRCECDPSRCEQTVCLPGQARILLYAAFDQPGHCCDQYTCVTGEESGHGNCSLADCPKVHTTSCPPDSIIALTSSKEDHCCPHAPKCECVSICTKPSCGVSMVPRLLQSGNGTPGHCCDIYECVNETRTTCAFNGMEYMDGELYRLDVCRYCRCRGGISFCFSAQCGRLTCAHHYVPDGECCPVCEDELFPVSNPAGCFAKGHIRAHGDRWREDDCTFCQCADGEHHCTATACGQSCLHPVHVPGECCPVCEEPTFITIRPPVCPPLNHCSLDDSRCKFGFRLDRDGCRLCQCKTKAEHCGGRMAGCSLTCPHGLIRDELGCEICQCRLRPKKCRLLVCSKHCPHGYVKNRHGCNVCRCAKCKESPCDKFCLYGFQHSNKGCRLCKCKAAPELLATVLPPTGSSWCVSMDGQRFANGESWHDGCRHCLCQGGREMCSLIACPILPCLAPKLQPGHCCPSCPDTTEQIAPVAPVLNSVCQALGGDYFLEGESWSVDLCTRCTCHEGRILCDAEVCPPLLCTHPERPKGSCCPVCPAAEPEPETKNSSWPLFCVSENEDMFLDGEAWKADACVSCVCRGGVVTCFPETCPVLSCKRPVLRKGQCCPYCLEVIVPLKVCYYSDQVFGEGERWSLDACTHCECRAGEAVCILEDCLAPRCDHPQLRDGSCCPVCLSEDYFSAFATNIPIDKSDNGADPAVAVVPWFPTQSAPAIMPERKNSLPEAAMGEDLESSKDDVSSVLQPILWVVVGVLGLGLSALLLALLLSRRRQWIPLQLYKPPVKTVYPNNEIDKNTSSTKVPLNSSAKVQRLAEPDPRYSGYYSMLHTNGASV
uniref:Cysteine-rich motor neuron 1 protein n=1 Tax=Eptatretus burgeri TaxID=7764 RepID=A0A8C4X142_EPTBU